MKDDLRVLMDDFYATGMALSRTLGTQEGRDAQFCASQVGQAMAVLNMRCGEQWGIKLREIPIVPEVIEPVVEAIEEEPVKAPKPKKAK